MLLWINREVDTLAGTGRETADQPCYDVAVVILCIAGTTEMEGQTEVAQRLIHLFWL